MTPLTRESLDWLLSQEYVNIEINRRSLVTLVSVAPENQPLKTFRDRNHEDAICRAYEELCVKPALQTRENHAAGLYGLNFMEPTKDSIRAAINAAEFAIKPHAHSSLPVSVTHETLTTLLFAANEHLSMNAKERLKRLELGVHEAMEALRGAL